jgi:hypothetical protein
MRDDEGVGTPNDAWVLAVDVRVADWLLATAGAGGPVPSSQAVDQGRLDLRASGPSARPPLAVVVVHPATWDPARVAAVLDEVAAASGLPDWPAPVPLTVAEAVAWRALQFGLVPARARLAVLDPVAGEAAVVDRDGDTLAAVGAPVRLEPSTAGAGPGSQDLGVLLVALARRALDAAPAGPPFAGVLLAGALPGPDADAAELPGLVARISGRAPLVPGDPTRAAVLGGAALGWAAATSLGDDAADADAVLPVPRTFTTPAPLAPPAGAEAGSPGARGAVARPLRLRVWAAVLGVLVLLAIVAGLGWHRARTAPSPFTYTCPDGQVVAYSFECPTLAPSGSP